MKNITPAAVRNAVANVIFDAIGLVTANTPDGKYCVEVKPLSLNENLLEVMAMVTPCERDEKIDGTEMQKVRLNIEVMVAARQEV